MSISALESALGEFVGDTIVNICGREAPTVLRYHGGPVPETCCTDEGVLSVWWERIYPSATFPAQSSGSDPCVGPPVVRLSVRYQICWPGRDVGPNGLMPVDGTWDERAAMLAEVADCVERALIRLSCGGPDPDLDPFGPAVLAEVRGKSFRWVETLPARPLGLCAGVTWSVLAAIRTAETAS